MPAPAVFYQEKLKGYDHLLSEKRKQSSRLGIFRLLVFVVFIYCSYRWLSGWEQAWLMVSVISIFIFVLLVRFSVSLKERIDWLDKLRFINHNESAILKGLPNAFDNGVEHGEPGGYLADLDIFGQNSLYHLLNRTTTSHGRNALANQLKHQELDAIRITSRQQAIQMLSLQPETCQAIIAAGLSGKEEKGNLSSVVEWLHQKPVILPNKLISTLRIIFPVMNAAFLLYYLATDNYLPLLAGVFLCWGITGYYARYIMKQHMLVARKADVLQQYAGILKQFSAVKTQDVQELEKLIYSTRSAAKSISGLSKLSSLFDQRLNVLVYIMLNSFLLYDIHLVRALEQWKETNCESFTKWIESVGTIEMLVSLASFRYNNPGFIFPEPVSGKLLIRAEGICHPLIPEHERVGNPVEAGLPEKLFLITGSNMSGKTTYLRTLGVSMVLAQSGAPVCAVRFQFTPMQVLTSIRVTDSLQEHTSYFLAELKQLRYIVDRLKSGIPALVLVDEILRGTNSEDKNHGSEAFIEKILQYDALCFFATHDLSLGILEDQKPGLIKNVCFESTLKDNELVFDYTLRKGLAKNKNASFLMEQMGII